MLCIKYTKAKFGYFFFALTTMKPFIFLIIIIVTGTITIDENHLCAQEPYDIVFTKTYGGSSAEAAGFGNANFGSPAVSIDFDQFGSMYIASYSASADGLVTQNFGGEDAWLLKVNAEGDTLWTAVLGGSADERVYHVMHDQQDHVYICGRTNSNDGPFAQNNGGSDAFIAKYTNEGELVWVQVYGGSQPESFYELMLNNNLLVVVGETGSSDGDLSGVPVGQGEAWILGVNPETGVIVWQSVIAGAQQPNNPNYIEHFWSVAHANNGYIAVGTDGDFIDFNSDKIFVVRTDLNGNLVWRKSFGSDARDWAAKIIRIDSGDYLIVGSCGGGGGDVSNYNGGGSDVWLLKINSDGELLDEVTYGGSDLEYPYNVTRNFMGGIDITGGTRSNDGHLADTPGDGSIDAWFFSVNQFNLISYNHLRWGGSGTDFAHGSVTAEALYVVGRTASTDGEMSENFGETDLFLTRFILPTNTPEVVRDAEAMTLYPNPGGRNGFFIELSEKGTLTVTDALGQKVYESLVYEGRNHVSWPIQKSGTYLVQFKSASSYTRTSTTRWICVE